MTTHELAHILLTLPDTKLALGANNHTTWFETGDHTSNDLIHISNLDTYDGPRIIVANYHRSNDVGGNEQFKELLFREPHPNKNGR